MRPPARPRRAREPLAPVLVALGYAVLGLTWILMSDGLVEWLFSDPAQRRWVQTSKGTGYVLVTATLLWLVMRGLFKRLDDARRGLADREAEWRAVFTEHPAPLFVVAPDTGQVLESNRAATQLYGRSIEHLVGRRFGDFEAGTNPPDPEPSTGGGPAARFNGLHRHVGGEGRTRWVDLHAVAVTHRGQPAVLVHVLDLTAEREVHEALSFARSHDPLTSLPNRRALLHRLDGWFARRASDEAGTLLLFDLDGFRRINQAWSTAAADQVLRAVAGRLRQACRPGDILARTGMDEFALFMPQVSDATAASDRAEALRVQVSAPFNLGSEALGLSACVGVALTSELSGGAEAPAEAFLRRALAGLARAKLQGPGAVAFADATAQAEAADALRLLAALRQALNEDEQLVLRYQPLFDLQTGALVGAEALAEWHHPERGRISAGRFIPLAERAGLIDELGRHLLARALADGRVWIPAAPGGVRVYLNISPVQLRAPEFACQVIDQVKDADWPLERLGLEITESAVMDPDGPARDHLTRLHAAGLALALDDFGSGYSSLGALRDLPFDRVKLDQTFIRDLPASEADAGIVRAVVGLAKGLGIEVVAEGIEGEGQRAAAQALGCHVGQGYGLGRPVTPEALAELLRHAPPVGRTQVLGSVTPPSSGGRGPR